jgi:hypothetical protein
LEKTSCEHVKVAVEAEAIFSSNDMKEPSTNASLMGGKFYSNVWMKGGREMAYEAIKRVKKNLMTPEKRQRKLKKLLNAQ